MTTTSPEKALAPEQPLSGVGVLDKASLLLGVLEAGPASLTRLVADTGLKRPTAHRLVLALERLRLLARDKHGRFILGPRLGVMAVQACQDRLLTVANPVLAELRDVTGANARLYRRRGNLRICVAAAPAPSYDTSGPYDSVPIGAAFPMNAGPTSQVLLAWEEPEVLHEMLRGSRFTAASLSSVRRQGWAQSIDVRKREGAEVAAPVYGPGGRVVAALSAYWPGNRMPSSAGRMHVSELVDAAVRIGRGFPE